MCFDGTKRLCHIRGKLRKRQWINAQGIFVINLSHFKDIAEDQAPSSPSRSDSLQFLSLPQI